MAFSHPVGGSRTKKSRHHNVHVSKTSFTQLVHQAELLEVARQRNTIICLGSETGKSFLGVSLIKQLAYQIRQPLADGGKRTVFLVNTASQIDQHMKCIRLHTDLNVGALYEEDEHPDIGSKVSTHNVLVMSPRSFFDSLCADILKMSQVNLLIVDECHHALGNETYSKIMEQYDSYPLADRPTIMGLTTSVLNSECDSPTNLENELNALEHAMRSTAETSTDVVNSDIFTTRAEEAVLCCDEYVDNTGLVKEIDDIIESCLIFIQQCNLNLDEGGAEMDPRSIPKSVYYECRLVLHVLGPWCASRIAQTFVRQLTKLIENEKDTLRLQFLQWAHTQLQMITTLFELRFNKVMCLEDFMELVSPRVKQLLNVLYSYKPADNYTIVPYNGVDDYFGIEEASDESDMDDDEEPSNIDESQTAQPCVTASDVTGMNEQDKLCGVVLVDRRHVAFALNKLLEELGKWDEDLFFVECSHITGNGTLGKNAKRTKETEVQFKKQEQVLRRFRLKEINLLVATSVVEEGVDLPHCNLVVKFDLPTTFRSYVQSKGCAKATKSKYIMMVDQEKQTDFSENLAIFKGIEKILKARCYRQQDADNLDSSVVDGLMKPYVASQQDEAAKVTLTSAIEIVNRYCAKLPSDAFTHLAPKCTTKCDEGQYVSTLQLPINSPVKQPIIGASMKTERLAQMAVALKTCEILHRNGELDDTFQPVREEMLQYRNEVGYELEEVGEGQPRPGTTKRKQYYSKKISEQLNDGHPCPGTPCYLYLIDMKLTRAITEEQNTRGRSIDDPENTPCCFGILTSKQMPLVPEFPVFTRSGEVTISLVLMKSEVMVCDEDIASLNAFHRYMFSYVLRLEKSPMAFKPEQALVGFTVVPVLKDGSSELGIDWSFVKRINAYQGCRPEKKGAGCTPSNPFKFNKEEFEDTVIMPSYRNIDQPQFFYMADILWDLSPLSPFPSPEFYETFNDYYVSKYGLVITNLKQPLLDVDHTSARLNLSTPRYLNQKGVPLPTSSAETKKSMRENLQQKQIFVPELSIIHPLPASMWRKAVCLPTILYRINYLLLADEMRARISKEAHIGVEKVPDGFRFPKLEFVFGSKKPEKETSPCPVEDTNDEECVAEEESEFEGHDLDFGMWKATSGALNDSDEKETEAIHPPNLHDEWPVHKENDVPVDDELVAELILESDTVNPMKSNVGAKKDEIANPTGQSDVKNDDNSNGLTDSLNNRNLAYDNSEIDSGNISEIKNETGNPKRKDMDETFVISEGGANRQHSNNVSTDNKDLKKQHEASCDILDGSEISKQCSEDTLEPTCSRDTTKSVLEEDVYSSFDAGVDLNSFIGPSPCLILQTLTMSNANDFFNLERLETIGDSFLKFAITVYLYSSYPGIHEGKLSFLRSKQVSNFNLYRLGKEKKFGEFMIVSKFEPAENWLPPGYIIDEEKVGKIQVNSGGSKNSRINDNQPASMNGNGLGVTSADNQLVQKFNEELEEISHASEIDSVSGSCMIPYNLQTQHSLPDKSIADCVESLIGCYLTVCGSKAALQFMSWLGLKVFPKPSPQRASLFGQPSVLTSRVDEESPVENGHADGRSTGGDNEQTSYGVFPQPLSPLLTHVPHASGHLNHHLNGFEAFEEKIQYHFRDRSFLLQAFTHASYHYNTVTDCYQRLEFLGDAILDYVITHHLYEDKQMFSPGIITDLRSALVNNNIFAVLAVKWEFHKYFKAVSPQLFAVIQKFVSWMKSKGDDVNLEEELMEEEEDEEDEEDRESEHIEIPKALGDIFESVAGAVYLDSGHSLDTVWKVYYRMMKSYIDQYTDKIPKSPVRELLEMEPETAKFERPERTMDGKIRVTVNVVGKGSFSGVGRNYRIAKSAAAKRALRTVKMMY